MWIKVGVGYLVLVFVACSAFLAWAWRWGQMNAKLQRVDSCTKARSSVAIRSHRKDRVPRADAVRPLWFEVRWNAKALTRGQGH